MQALLRVRRQNRASFGEVRCSLSVKTRARLEQKNPIRISHPMKNIFRSR